MNVNRLGRLGGNMGLMDKPGKTITIQPVSVSASAGAWAGCGHCHDGADKAPLCRATSNLPGMAPEFTGPAADVARLMAALASPLGFRPDTGGAGVVRALRVQAGEVELQLAVGSHCGAELLDRAFQTLRSLLPDTDIYVSPMH